MEINSIDYDFGNLWDGYLMRLSHLLKTMMREYGMDAKTMSAHIRVRRGFIVDLSRYEEGRLLVVKGEREWHELLSNDTKKNIRSKLLNLLEKLITLGYDHMEDHSAIAVGQARAERMATDSWLINELRRLKSSIFK